MNDHCPGSTHANRRSRLRLVLLGLGLVLVAGVWFFRNPLRHRTFALATIVAMCSLCRRYEKQLQMFRLGLHHHANPDENSVVESLAAEAKARLRQALEQSGQ